MPFQLSDLRRNHTAYHFIFYLRLSNLITYCTLVVLKFWKNIEEQILDGSY